MPTITRALSNATNASGDHLAAVDRPAAQFAEVRFLLAYGRAPR